MRTITIIFGLAVFVGGILAMLSFREQVKPTASRKKLVLFGTLVFAVTFGLLNYLFALVFIYESFQFDVACEGMCGDFGNRCNESLSTKELWLRLMTPPNLVPDCYSTNTAVCTATDLVEDEKPERLAVFLLLVGAGFVSASFSSLMIWGREDPNFDIAQIIKKAKL